MGGEWIERTIGDIADVVGGSTPSTKDPSNFDGDIPWITPKDLSGVHPRYVSRGARNLSKKGLESCSARLLPRNSILLSSRAPIGYVAIAANPIATNQGFRSLVLREGYDHEFVYYWLKLNTSELERHASGSTFKELSGSALKQIRIRLPRDREEQRAIELNRRMNRTLEAIAQAIFKSWFVDFDPVIDNALAAGKSIPEEFAERAARRAQLAHGKSPLPENIRRLFPYKFQDSELGPIPTGWEVKPLSALMTFQGGSQPPASEFISEPRPGYVRLVQIRDFYTSSHVTYVPDTPKLRKFTIDDIMIARYGSSGNAKKTSDSLGRICRGLEGAYNVALVKVIPHGPWREFLYYFLQTSSFQSVIKGMGARSVQSGFRKGDLDVIWVVSPSLPVLSAFEGFADFIWKHTYKTNERSRTLAALRNTLLPKLISGKIRVKDAEWSLRGGRA